MSTKLFLSVREKNIRDSSEASSGKFSQNAPENPFLWSASGPGDDEVEAHPDILFGEDAGSV